MLHEVPDEVEQTVSVRDGDLHQVIFLGVGLVSALDLAAKLLFVDVSAQQIDPKPLVGVMAMLAVVQSRNGDVMVMNRHSHRFEEIRGILLVELSFLLRLVRAVNLGVEVINGIQCDLHRDLPSALDVSNLPRSVSIFSQPCRVIGIVNRTVVQSKCGPIEGCVAACAKHLMTAGDFVNRDSTMGKASMWSP